MNMSLDIIYDYNFNIGDKVFVVSIGERDISFPAFVIGVVESNEDKQYIIEARPEVFKDIDLLSPNINIKTRPGYIAGIVYPDELIPAYRRLELVINNK